MFSWKNSGSTRFCLLTVDQLSRGSFFRQLVVFAATAGEIAETAQRILVLDLNSAGVVNAFAVTTATRLFPVLAGHTRMLPQKEGTILAKQYLVDRAIQEAEFILERIDKRWPVGAESVPSTGS